MNDLLGWAASATLIITISLQLAKQIRHKSAKDVSLGLFGGNLVASIGFVIYSYNLENWVFLSTNSFLVAQNILGLFLTYKYRNQART